MMEHPDSFAVRVEHLTPSEVMQSMRRMMRKTYLILWAAVYAVVLVVALVQRHFSVFTWVCPAVILILLALAYEFSGRKNFGPMKYDEAVLDYVISPEGYSLTVGGQTAEFSWQQAKLRHSRSDFLLYSDQKNCSVLPKRCLTPEQTQKLQTWAKA